MRAQILALTVLAAAAAGLPSASRAQSEGPESGLDEDVVHRISTGHVVAALRAGGAEDLVAGKGFTGVAKIQGTARDLRFGVSLHDCRNGGCRQLQFRITFRINQLDPESARALAEDWNRRQVFGRAYVNHRGHIALEHAMDISGGVTRANLKRNAARWIDLMDAFAGAIGWES